MREGKERESERGEGEGERERRGRGGWEGEGRDEVCSLIHRLHDLHFYREQVFPLTRSEVLRLVHKNAVVAGYLRPRQLEQLQVPCNQTVN